MILRVLCGETALEVRDGNQRPSIDTGGVLLWIEFVAIRKSPLRLGRNAQDQVLTGRVTRVNTAAAGPECIFAQPAPRVKQKSTIKRQINIATFTRVPGLHLRVSLPVESLEAAALLQKASAKRGTARARGVSPGNRYLSEPRLRGGTES